MGDLLKLLAFGATAAAAVVVAKEVIERSERGEDCSPLAVIKGIGRKIGDLCGNDSKDDEDFDDFEDFEAFSVLDDDDEGFNFDTADMESDKLDEDGFVQLEIEIETAPEVKEEPEAEAETAAADEADAEDETEAAVEEALKKAAELDDDEDDDDEELSTDE